MGSTKTQDFLTWFGQSLRPWRFRILFFFLFLTLVVEPILFGVDIRLWVFDVLYTVVLLSAMIALGMSRRQRLSVVIGGFATIITTWVVHLSSGLMSDIAIMVSHCLGAGFAALLVIVTVRALLRSREITVDCLFGAVSGYLLLGMAWGMVYSLLHFTTPESFDFGTTLSEYIHAGQARIPVFMYYSFVTLTTVGFGDMTPITPAARTLSWLEAVSGQFYLGVLVAGIVGIFVNRAADQRWEKRLRESVEDED